MRDNSCYTPSMVVNSIWYQLIKTYNEPLILSGIRKNIYHKHDGIENTNEKQKDKGM